MQNQTTTCFCLLLVDIFELSSDIFQLWIGLWSMFSSSSLIWCIIFHRDERRVSLKWCLNLTQAATNWNRLRKFVVSMVSSCLIRKWLKFLGIPMNYKGFITWRLDWNSKWLEQVSQQTQQHKTTIDRSFFSNLSSPSLHRGWNSNSTKCKSLETEAANQPVLGTFIRQGQKNNNDIPCAGNKVHS